MRGASCTSQQLVPFGRGRGGYGLTQSAETPPLNTGRGGAARGGRARAGRAPFPAVRQHLGKVRLGSSWGNLDATDIREETINWS